MSVVRDMSYAINKSQNIQSFLSEWYIAEKIIDLAIDLSIRMKTK